MADDSGATSPAVYLVGIDAATWRVLDPLMAEGRLPNLRLMTSEGARGVLRSMDPTASAIIWTTIATGKTPEKHGIHGFVVPASGGGGGLIPVTSTLRKTKALWNIVGDAGMEVGFVGWWVTWPAEQVRGFLCSDYTWPLRKDDQGFATGEDTSAARRFRTYPEDLMTELDPLLLTESRLSKAQLDSLGVSRIPPVQGDAVREIFLKDLSYVRISDHLLSRFSPRLFAVYFEGLDAFCHIFWPRYATHRGLRSAVPTPGDARQTGRWLKGEAMDDHLVRLDAFIGVLTTKLRPEDVLIVVSDHGYGENPDQAPILRTEGDWIRPPHWHTIDGIFAARGGGIRQGATLDTLSILDVAPTILAILGLPLAEDMDGRVPPGLLDDSTYARALSRTIATYDSVARGGEAVASPYDEEMLERLKALGYLN